MKRPAAVAADCPCGSGRRLEACCGLLHAGTQQAATPEALMRSRYSAFVLGDEADLRATWHASTRPEQLDLAADGAVRWLGLEVRGSAMADEMHGTVEFVARYRVGGRGQRLHETSRFVREADGRWYYVDGDLH